MVGNSKTGGGSDLSHRPLLSTPDLEQNIGMNIKRSYYRLKIGQ